MLSYYAQGRIKFAQYYDKIVDYQSMLNQSLLSCICTGRILFNKLCGLWEWKESRDTWEWSTDEKTIYVSVMPNTNIFILFMVAFNCFNKPQDINISFTGESILISIALSLIITFYEAVVAEISSSWFLIVYRGNISLLSLCTAELTDIKWIKIINILYGRSVNENPSRIINRNSWHPLISTFWNVTDCVEYIFYYSMFMLWCYETRVSVKTNINYYNDVKTNYFYTATDKIEEELFCIFLLS